MTPAPAASLRPGGPGTRRRLARDAAAASAVIGAIVGLVVGGTLLAVLLLEGQDARPDATRNPVSQQVLEEEASNVGDILLGSGGRTASGGDWKTAPDGLSRLGLLDGVGTRVDYAKLVNLRLAPLDKDSADGYVNYEEARQSLDLDDKDLDVHIRAAPRLRSLDEMLARGDRDEALRVGYIGNALGESGEEGGGGADITGVTCNGNGPNIDYTVSAHNTGSTATQFTAVVTFRSGSTTLTTNLNGPEVVGGATVTFGATVPVSSAALCSASATATVELYDPDVSMGTESFALAAPATTPGSTDMDLALDTQTPYFLASDNVRLTYDSRKLKNSDTVTLTVKDSSGTTVHSSSFALGAPPTRTKDIGSLPVGDYVAELTFSTSRVKENVVVVATAPGPYTAPGATPGAWNWHGAVPTEVEQVEKIAKKFCPYEYDSASGSPLASPPAYAPRCDHIQAPLVGSVFPDIKSILNNDLPDFLLDATGAPTYAHFTVLVVGSEVDHNAMTSAAAKHAIRDWVYGGGTLIVFGSEEQSVQWLQPIFHAAIQSSSGGISTPDSLHPVLHSPDRLDWTSYVNVDDRVWTFNAGADAHFTKVVAQGGEAVLALSDPGDFQDGNVYLSTWMPYDMYGDGTPDAAAVAEGMKLIHNLLMMGYRDLYLDYGPPIPEDAPVMTSVRLATVQHPDLGDKAVQFTVYVFSGRGV